MIDPRRFPDLWRGLDVTVRDLPLGPLILAMSFVPAYHTVGTQSGGMPDRPFDLLDPDHGTQDAPPPVARLLPRVERTRRAGQSAEFTEEGTPAEPEGSVGLAAFRGVQEALTNALEYAHGSRTAVQVHHSEREIKVEVSTDGSGSAAGAPGGSRRGLVGLRERVDVLGGDFSAGPGTRGGFVVRASIPAGSRS